MRIVLTGGGSGGHFYPLIAVAEELNKQAAANKLIDPELFFISESPYDQKLLLDNNITFKQVSAGKLRRYFSLKNISDTLKTIKGLFQGFVKMYDIYPDVVFSKGGYASFPSVFAAKILKIPVFIHESDSVPGRMNAWAGKFAVRIAVSFPGAAEFFPKGKVAFTGNPIRKEIKEPVTEGSKELLGFSPDIPIIFIIGGSQGSETINSFILRTLPSLVEKYQILHQTGPNNYNEVAKLSKLALEKSNYAERYKAYDYLDTASLRMAAGAASLIVSRAGSTIFEIAQWGKPSIIIPITDSNGDHQRMNAYHYAKSGACIVIEEINLSPQVFNFQIDKLFSDSNLLNNMSAAAKAFAKPEAAAVIAGEIIKIALSHEK